MDLFGLLSQYDYGAVHVGREPASGMQCIVAIHDTRLGPAIGGCRFLSYADEREAFIDALRLARGMTYKAALANLPHGGGKTVMLRPQRLFDRAAMFRAFGRFLEGLSGRYYTAEDSGTGIEDMEVVRSVTKYVVGTGGGSGDPSPFTALGVRRGIEACVRIKLGRTSLEGIHVAVQGVGHVGYHLCRELSGQGATLSVADVDPLKAERAQREFGANVVPIERIFDVECDVLAPCALGSALNDQTIPRLRCMVVAGAANNQLAEPRHGDDLHFRGILYAPDYAINAGGLINVALELEGYNADKARERTMKVYDTIHEIADRSRLSLTPTYRVADLLVEEKLAQVTSKPK
ncbi:MAG TPA: Glu/Leu/Phe/Val dehydrogenase dimerization domain-containing protein [Polyangiaceae bacterium]|jgi:leucine dehydrogenase|nr:Glu/Leu/Phe/Val dehydrogenase dimerization domain-containing protein [Polyangiaceae bacterium]